MKRDAIDSLPGSEAIKPWVDHFTTEVKVVRTHRCLAGLKDAANSAGRLIRVVEKLRNRAMKTKKGKGGKAKDDVLSSDGAMPTGLSNLQMFYADCTGATAELAFEKNVMKDKDLIAQLWPMAGSYFGKAFVLEGEARAFVSDVRAAGFYKKLTQWINGFVEEQQAQQAATAILIPSAVQALTKYRSEELPAELLQNPGFVDSEKTWGSKIFEPQLTLGLPQSWCTSISDYGVGEVRVCVEGKELWMGYPAESVGGKDLIEKVDTLHALSL